MGKTNDWLNHILQDGTAPEAGEKERKEMLNIFHQPELEYKLKETLFEEINAYVQPETSFPNCKKLFIKLWKKIEQINIPPKPKIKITTRIQIAAAIIIGLFLGIYISSTRVQQKSVFFSAESSRGSVSKIILPDSSIVFLNADSQIEFTRNEDNVREVSLSGEAWFNVKKHEENPFIVHTPMYDINVTGTSFNVKAYESDNTITTTLEKGQVKIHSNEYTTLAEDIILEPGEQVVFNKNTKKLAIKKVNIKWFSSWKNNELIFVNMKLKDLVKMLERKYGVNIEVKNKDILDLHFDGTIKNESILELLEIIKETLPIKYKIVGQNIEITKQKLEE